MNELGYRNIWISLAIGWAVAAVGLVLLRNSAEAKTVLALAGVVLTVMLCHMLDHRTLRKHEDD